MSRIVRRTACSAAAVVVIVIVLHGGFARAQEPTTAPSIALSQTSVRPGEHVLVTIDGFKGGSVTMSVCGNLAARRSVDCNLTGSEARRLNRDHSPTIADLPVGVPPATCPCVVVASTQGFEEFAVTPIDLIGHPVGPIVRPESFRSLEVSLTAQRAPHGLIARLRSWVGGPTAYDVTVSVQNRSTETLDGVVLAGSAGRSRSDDVSALEIPPVGSLAAGETWTSTVRTEIPAPVLGGFVWQVTASGAGPAVSAQHTTHAMPLGLVLLVFIFVLDVGAIVWRRVARRRRERTHDVDAGVIVDVLPASGGTPALY